MLNNLNTWYGSKNKRQRNILRVTAFLLCVAGGPYTIMFVAPWMVPMMLFLEFHLNTENS